jgi:hypothetical protein
VQCLGKAGSADLPRRADWQMPVGEKIAHASINER